MLRPATVVDLPVLRALIREGAMTGNFDRDLATESRAAAQFFANLRQALATGYFVEEDPISGNLVTVAAPGYVYLPDDPDVAHRPIGFGLFRATPTGYELWLTGVDAAWRGHGHGRAMLAALLSTTPGRRAYATCVNAGTRESLAMEHLLRSFGYSCTQRSPRRTWYLRHDAPPEAGRRLGIPAPLRSAG
jgi:GNAT superfamily N-acetyltransferase